MKNKVSFLLMLFVLFFINGCAKLKPHNNSNIIKLKDSFEREVVLKKNPENIISLSPAVTEIFYALGSEEKLAGRTDYCDYPEDVKIKPSVGSIMSPNIEAILSLKPDLIIASDHFQKNTLSEIEKMGIPVYIGFLKNDYNAVYDLIDKIGKITDKTDAAEKIIKQMKYVMESIETKAKKAETKPKVYYMISYGDAGNFTAGRETYISSLIKKAGGDNIGDAVVGWEISYENLLESEPDIIICSRYNNVKEGIFKNDFFKKLGAVKKGKVYEIDINLIDRIGPRNMEGLKVLAEIIHPEIFLK